MKVSDFLSVAVDAMYVVVCDSSTAENIYEGPLDEIKDVLEGIDECEIASIDQSCAGELLIFVYKYEKPKHKYYATVRVAGELTLEVESFADVQKIEDAVTEELRTVNFNEMDCITTKISRIEDSKGKFVFGF